MKVLLIFIPLRGISLYIWQARDARRRFRIFSSPYEELVYISSFKFCFFIVFGIWFSSPYEELVYISYKLIEEGRYEESALGFRPLTRN